MIVTVSRRSGLTKAYTSVLSACGSVLINGASRCDEARAWYGLQPMTRASMTSSIPTTGANLRIVSSFDKMVELSLRCTHTPLLCSKHFARPDMASVHAPAQRASAHRPPPVLLTLDHLLSIHGLLPLVA